MSIVRWNPWSDLESLHDDIDRAFRRANVTHADFLPTTDVHETKEAFELAVDLPGVKLEDVHIEVADRVLKVQGERRDERKVEQGAYRRTERSFGKFVRSFGLGNDIDDQGIVAKMQDGVLHLRLPKRAGVQPRKIAIAN